MKDEAMTGDERRDAILRFLWDSTKPQSGGSLGRQFKVSRQVIVQDIALLRSQGAPIVSTNRGYLIERQVNKAIRLFKCHHTLDQTQEELNLMVDIGGTAEDVLVNHRAYGKMSAPVGIKNRRDVSKFIADIESGASTPLMNITSGYHFHHVSAESEEILDEIEDALRQRGFLVPLSDYEVQNFRELSSVAPIPEDPEATACSDSSSISEASHAGTDSLPTHGEVDSSGDRS